MVGLVGCCRCRPRPAKGREGGGHEAEDPEEAEAGLGPQLSAAARPRRATGAPLGEGGIGRVESGWGQKSDFNNSAGTFHQISINKKGNMVFAQVAEPRACARKPTTNAE